MSRYLSENTKTGDFNPPEDAHRVVLHNSWVFSINPCHSFGVYRQQINKHSHMYIYIYMSSKGVACPPGGFWRTVPSQQTDIMPLNLVRTQMKCRSTIIFLPHLNTACALIFVGFNICGFRGSAAIREYCIHEYLNVTVNGHVHSSNQSMTSCVTKMAISRRLVCCSL